MKLLIALAVTFASVSLFAENSENQRKLKIDSFVYVENGSFDNKSAELCGHVTGNVHVHDRVTVSSDPQTKAPGNYTTLLDAEGKFCVIVRTLSGKASAKYWNLSNPGKIQTADGVVTK